MAGSQNNKNIFSDILLNACDSYLDALTCKQYTDAIFSTEAFSNTGVSSDYDSREDIMAIRARDLGDNRRAEKSDKSDIVRPLRPMALDDESDDDEAVRSSAEISSKDVFRLTRNRNGEKSKYAEFYKLCRCTAWSMDSDGSGIEESSVYSINDEKGDRPTNRVHWDEIVSDVELDGRLVVSMD